MATEKRSALELADMVEATAVASPASASQSADFDDMVKQQEFQDKVETIKKVHKVPGPIATIMAETGYTKGTATRIFNDRSRKANAEREARAVAEAAVAAAPKAGARKAAGATA